MDQRLVFVDLETAGVNCKRHPIIQIAAIAVDHGLRQLDAFEAKIMFSTKAADQRSLRKNHYHAGTWAREAREEPVVADEFSAFLRRHASVAKISASGESYRVAQLVAHNAAFDGAFLDAWFARVGLFLPAGRHILCTMQRALWFFSEHPDRPRPKNVTLASLCHYFRVPFHAAAAHEALADVTATVALYGALIEVEDVRRGAEAA